MPILQPISEAFTGDIVRRVSGAGGGVQPELSLKKLGRQPKGAVVARKALNLSSFEQVRASPPGPVPGIIKKKDAAERHIR